MEIIFLGTSAGVPTSKRNVSSVAIRLPQRGEVWLLDCGEGTQQQVLKSAIKISQIRRIFITHMHGDHIFGLPGFLATLSLSGNTDAVDIYAPKALEPLLEQTLYNSHSYLSFDLSFHEHQPGILYEDEDMIVQGNWLEHYPPAMGYAISEKEKAGRFNLEKAKQLGIPPGPLYKTLKEGQNITLEDGRVIEGKSLCDAPRPGRKIVYCTDTTYCQQAVELAYNADALIHEATFMQTDRLIAEKSLHSTASMAAQVALEAQVKQLLITHFSPRYTGLQENGVSALLHEARAIFPNTLAAYDFYHYLVKSRA